MTTDSVQPTITNPTITHDCDPRYSTHMQTRPERSSYTPLDFQQWAEVGGLELSPKFQRRNVWTNAARSYLIDTLLLGLPVPPIYIRVLQNPQRTKPIREVVDGQQRISAILDFVAGKFSLAKNIETDVSGKRFSQLTGEQQDRILQYPFICEVFHGITDADVLSIFARLNTHSVKLNGQELRNGRWFGHFKRLSYALALEHLEFWKSMRIFTDAKIARMAEVEFTSELLIMGIDGLQDKKKSIDDFYQQFDDSFPRKSEVEKRFRDTIDNIIETCEGVLPSSEFRRPPLFYSLYGCVFHRLFGVPKLGLARRGSRLSANDREGLETAVRKLSEVISEARAEEGETPKALRSFVAACLRQTDNVKPRTTRLCTLYNKAFGG